MSNRKESLKQNLENYVTFTDRKSKNRRSTGYPRTRKTQFGGYTENLKVKKPTLEL